MSRPDARVSGFQDHLVPDARLSLSDDDLSDEDQGGAATRRELASTGAVGFLDMIPPREPSLAPSATRSKLLSYANDLRSATAGADRRRLGYTLDLVQAYWPNPRQSRAALETPDLLRALVNAGAALLSGPLRAAKGSKGRLKGSSSTSAVKAHQSLFVPAVEALEVLGSWPAIFFSSMLVTESVMDSADLDRLRAAATCYGEGDVRSELQSAAAGLVQYLNFHETDPFGALLGHRVNPLLLSTLRWVLRDAVCTPFAGPLEFAPASVPAESKSPTPSAKDPGNNVASPSAPTLPVRRRFTVLPKRDRLSGGAESPPSGGGSPSSLSFVGGGSVHSAEAQLAEVLSRVNEWAELPDDAAVADAVREYAAVVRQSLFTIKPGDIVLVCWRTEADRLSNEVYFGRFVCFVDSRSVAVFMDGLERDAWLVPTHLVAALPRSLSNPINVSTSQISMDTSWRSLLSTVIHPDETADVIKSDRVVASFVDTYLAEAFSSYSLDYNDVRQRIDNRQVTISDMPRLQRLIRMVSETPDGAGIWIDKARALVEEHAESVVSTLNMRKLFLPIRRMLFEKITRDSANVDNLFRYALTKVRVSVEGSLNLLRDDVANVCNGSRKKELINWWLKLTRTRIMSFLISLGYSENATSYDYINSPPLDYRGVQKNLQLLHRVLEDINESRGLSRRSSRRLSGSLSSVPSSGVTSGVTSPLRSSPVASPHMPRRSGSSPSGSGSPLAAQPTLSDAEHVWTVIDGVKDEVYAQINSYINECTVILCETFRLPIEAFSTDTVQKLFRERMSTFPELQAKQLSALVDDIDYLREMKRLEENPREKSMHIVPISGLCVGRVVRLESEMRTVVEVWGSKFSRTVYSTVDEEELSSDGPSLSAPVPVAEEQQAPVVDLEELRKMVRLLQRNVRVEDRYYRMVRFNQCWVGSEAVDYLVLSAGLTSRRSATTLCSHLLMHGLIEPVLAGMPFVDGWEFYRFTKDGARDLLEKELLSNE